LADSFHEKTEAEIRRGVLQVAVLARLRGQAYGYDLIRVLNEAGLPVEEGTLYPVLRRLETAGLLESIWDTTGKRPRKYYRTTDEGVSAMTKLFDAWAHVDRSLRALVLESDTEPALGDQEQPA
jgi:DNA-binding PadR family transcriptional regulator